MHQSLAQGPSNSSSKCLILTHLHQILHRFVHLVTHTCHNMTTCRLSSPLDLTFRSGCFLPHSLRLPNEQASLPILQAFLPIYFPTSPLLFNYAVMRLRNFVIIILQILSDVNTFQENFSKKRRKPNSLAQFSSQKNYILNTLLFDLISFTIAKSNATSS